MVNSHRERRSNETHRSSTDPEAKMARKGAGKEVRLYYSGNAVMENRNSILLDFQVESADGFAGRRRKLVMADARPPGTQRIALGADKGYDTRDFVSACRALKITPHVAQNHARAGGSALDTRTARHPGYAISQRIRKRVEAFGWIKTVSGLRKTRHRGRHRVQMHGYMVAEAYNLIRIAHLAPASAHEDSARSSSLATAAGKPAK